MYNPLDNEIYTEHKPVTLADWFLGASFLVGLAALIYLLLLLAAK
jgi:hypothetical protein